MFRPVYKYTNISVSTSFKYHLLNRILYLYSDGLELEYEIYSQILSIIYLSEPFEIQPIVMEFKHEQTTSTNRSIDDIWAVKCAVADMNSFTYIWDIYSCRTEPINSLTTRCVCPKSGIFALLLTMLPPAVSICIILLKFPLLKLANS